jgi:hypothetical protein
MSPFARLLVDAQKWCVLSSCMTSVALDSDTSLPLSQQHAANASQVLDLNVSHDTNLVAIASVAFAMQTPVRVGLDVMHIKNPWEGSSLDELIEGLAEQASPLQEAFAPLSTH